MDLYQQFEHIQQQCDRRSLSHKQTIDIMRLCIYGYLGQFPKRTTTLPWQGHVLTSIQTCTTPGDNGYPFASKLKTPSQFLSGGLV